MSLRRRRSASSAISRCKKKFSSVRRVAIAASFPISSQLGAMAVRRMSAARVNSNATASQRARRSRTELLLRVRQHRMADEDAHGPPCRLHRRQGDDACGRCLHAHCHPGGPSLEDLLQARRLPSHAKRSGVERVAGQAWLPWPACWPLVVASRNFHRTGKAMPARDILAVGRLGQGRPGTIPRRP